MDEARHRAGRAHPVHPHLETRMSPRTAEKKIPSQRKSPRKSSARKPSDGRQADGGGSNGRPTEELVNQAASSRGFGSPHRPARGHGFEQRGLAYLPVSQLFEGRFGRMFRLPPYVPSAERIAAIAAVMVEQGGGDPALNNPDIPAGYTYFGQFVDHDLTFDPVRA